MDSGRPSPEPPSKTGIGRRQFLTGATAAAAVALIGGCGSDASPDTAPAGTSTTTTTPTAPVTAPQQVDPPTLERDPFSLGVASGDPTATSVILWTRLAPEPLAEDGFAGMPDQDASVIWEVAATEDFGELLAAGLEPTTADHAHSAHVDVGGLSEGADYYYRFRYDRWTSPVGRTRTLPTGSPTRFSLAVVNCQMIETGRYGAYRNLVDEDLDLVLHLGDYIYEYPGGDGEFASKPNRFLETLADYRLRYASYHRDPSLQAAHARFPFVLTWDDHEVANNYMGDILEGHDDPALGLARKTAAYQAWWENLPVRVDPPDGGDLVVHQALAVGDLARLHVLDERQDAAVPPCRSTSDALSDYGDCDDRLAQDRTRLGSEQEAWLQESLAEGGVTWNLLGNPVVLAGVNGGTDEDGYYLDTWDGFPQARQRLIDQLAEVDNPVVLTGDYHAGMVLDVSRTPFDTTSDVVAPEFMAPPISSVLFSQDVAERTPQLRQQLNEHGYLTVEVTPDLLTVSFRTVQDVDDLETAMDTPAVWTVAAGDPVARPA